MTFMRTLNASIKCLLALFLVGAAQAQTGTMTAAQAALLIQGLTGCSTAGYVFTPQASDCVAVSGSGTVTNTGGALTSNYVVLGNGGADTKPSATLSDDGTTATYSGTGGLALTAKADETGEEVAVSLAQTRG